MTFRKLQNFHHQPVKGLKLLLVSANLWRCCSVWRQDYSALLYFYYIFRMFCWVAAKHSCQWLMLTLVCFCDKTFWQNISNSKCALKQNIPVQTFRCRIFQSKIFVTNFYSLSQRYKEMANHKSIISKDSIQALAKMGSLIVICPQCVDS